MIPASTMRNKNARRERIGRIPRESTQVAPDVFRVRLSIVNAYIVGRPGARSGHWVLVDAGLPTSADKIFRAAAELFGANSRPAAIILTHGHFDHSGAAEELAEAWDVPVYAHRLEMPYLDGGSEYPPPDPSVGGGALALISPLMPRGPINLGPRLHLLPANKSVPGMRGWRWIHTPGHTPGHVSFYRAADATLIAGDAFITTRQASLFSAVLQPQEMNGPPQYFTPNWELAYASVVELNRLYIQVAATGHGKPMRGVHLRRGLDRLAAHFYELAVPHTGRYVDQPAISDGGGVVDVPPRVVNYEHVAIGIVVAGVATAILTSGFWKKKGKYYRDGEGI